MSGKFSFIKTASLKNRVYQNLLDAIFTGELLPGESLREMHLARDLEISQTSVREALVELEHVGLAIRVPNKGTIITKFSSQEIQERIALRIVLEELACADAVQQITPASLSQLKRRLNNISDAVSRNSHFEVAQADLEFHRCIWEMSGNKTLYRMLDQLTVPLFAFISIIRRNGIETLETVVASHEIIIRAFESGDMDHIKTIMSQHIGSVYTDFLNSGVEDLQTLAHRTVNKQPIGFLIPHQS